MLARDGLYAPTAQSALNYVLLGLVFWGYRVATLGWRPAVTLSIPAWRYVLLALVDVEANYLVVSAYASTSLASIQLLDCWTLPCAMLLSAAFLRLRYRAAHLVGVVVCLAGLATLIAADWSTAVATGADTAWGDALCLAGATLYAASNVAQEVIVKVHDRTEYLMALGACGAVVACIQVAALERDGLAALAAGGPRLVAPFLGFAACLFGMYCATTIALRDGDATLFNLSLLTSDAWAIAISAALGVALHPLVFLALGCIATGIVVYNAAGAPRAAAPATQPTAPPPCNRSSPVGGRVGASDGDASDGDASARACARPRPPVSDTTALIAAGGGAAPSYDTSSLIPLPHREV